MKAGATSCYNLILGFQFFSCFKLGMLFTDECDSFKDLIHLHSFSYDFHLRTVQEYLSSPEMGFKIQYHITSFLSDFIKFFNPIPRFCSNLIHSGKYTFLPSPRPPPTFPGEPPSSLFLDCVSTLLGPYCITVLYNTPQSSPMQALTETLVHFLSCCYSKANVFQFYSLEKSPHSSQSVTLKGVKNFPSQIFFFASCSFAIFRNAGFPQSQHTGPRSVRIPHQAQTGRVLPLEHEQTRRKR